MKNWYVVHTKIRQEDVALSNLQRQGYDCFLPLIWVEKLRRGKLQVVQEPLFPRYLFIRLGVGADSLSWAPIRSTLGVSRLVMFGQTPARLADDLVAEIQSQSESKAIQRRQFEPGQRVVVNHGPFAGVDAIYQMADGENRVMVLLNILSKDVKLVVPPSAIRQLA